MVTLNEFIEAAKTGGDAGLATVRRYINENRNNVANINAANQYGSTALICAASNGHAPIVTALLAIQGIDINHANQDGNTALICAANKGHAPIVTALLAIQGIDINHANQDGNTALICAAYKGHAAIVTALLAIQGIDINHANQDGNTALICAASNGHAPIVTALLAIQGIDINHANQYGNTVLICAASNGHAPIVTALLAIQGIDINHANQDGKTALIWAASNGHAPIVTALLAIQGIDINHAGRNRDTALHWGAYNGNEAIVKALLTKITNVNDLKREHNDHRTPAQEAERQGHPGIAALIVARITELERLQNNIEEKNPNPPALVVPKIPFKEQLKGIYEGEFPPRLCCPVSLDLMEDPITPSCGITFDRKSLIGWFAQKGNPAEVPCPVTRKPIKITELNISSTVLVLDLLQELVDTAKEKHANKNEGIAPILEEEQEEKVRPADEQYEDILLPPALDFANPLQAEPSLVENPNELKHEDVNLEKLIATKNLPEAFLKSLEGLTKSLPSTVNLNQSAASEAKIPAPKSPATIERERMIAARIKLFDEKPKLNSALSLVPSFVPTINPN